MALDFGGPAAAATGIAQRTGVVASERHGNESALELSVWRDCDVGGSVHLGRIQPRAGEDEYDTEAWLGRKGKMAAKFKEKKLVMTVKPNEGAALEQQVAVLAREARQQMLAPMSMASGGPLYQLGQGRYGASRASICIQRFKLRFVHTFGSLPDFQCLLCTSKNKT